ncbi:MAG: acyltransferase [Microbacterium sp.]|uniref:acyltransferase family protein n=1 Tax=Microbacterium sp. TaxID=51671 RepID=UPI0039E3E085
MTTRYDLLDLLRLIAAFFVVAIHSNPLYSFPVEFRWGLEGIARFAVPFFFLASGFLVQQRLDAIADRAGQWAYLRNHLIRIGGLYLAWYLIYFAAMWGNAVDRFGDLPPGEGALAIANAMVFRAVYAGTFGGSWFYAALVVGSLVVFGAMRTVRPGARAALMLPVLLVVILASNYFPPVASWLGIEAWEPFLRAANIPETALTALPYLAIGAWLSRHEDGIARSFPRPLAVAAVVVFAAAAAAEEIATKSLGWVMRSSDQFFSVPLLGVSVFLLALVFRDLRVRGDIGVIRQLSGFMYPVQFLVIRNMIEASKDASGVELNSIFQYALVIAIIVGVFFAFRRLSEQKGFAFVRGLW